VSNATAAKDSGIGTSASDRVNSNKEVTKISRETGIIPKSSDSKVAADTTSHDQRIELSGAFGSEERRKDFGGEGFRTQSDRAVQIKNVQAFLERLPEIQRQLLEAETAPGKAFAEFMAKLMPTKMQLRASAAPRAQGRLRGDG
jgi:hypothetical protein